jgi:hypothetical protein
MTYLGVQYSGVQVCSTNNERFYVCTLPDEV